MSNDILGLGSGVKEIERLAQQAQEKDFIVIDGLGTFTAKDLTQVTNRIDKRSRLDLHSLKSLIEMIKVDASKDTDLPISIIVEEQTIQAFSGLNERKEREHLYAVKSKNPQINFNSYMSAEEMIIQLQTSFKDTPNKSSLISLISKLSNTQTVEMEDDGITQNVVMKQGVTTEGKVTLPPLVKLVPQRSFYEIEQPEQMFLLRINRNAEVALFDADGGAWKANTQKTIIEYLNKELVMLVNEGRVIIG